MIRYILLLILPLVLGGCSPGTNGRLRGKQSFNNDWLFMLQQHGDTLDYSSTDVDDSGWRILSLPHDWAIEGNFSEDNPSGTGGGALPGGIGWYRKHFTLERPEEPEKIYIDFDGAYMNSSVYVNGHYLGTRPYGYAPFSYDITPYINYDGDNIVAVKVDNSDQPNSRWYSGCGIYRNVWLRRLARIHIPLWGQSINATVDDGKGKLDIITEVENSSQESTAVTLSIEVTDKEGKTVGSSLKTLTVPSDSISKCRQSILVDSPDLWNTENPSLYAITTEVCVNGKVVDSHIEKIGFRTLGFDAGKGFSLNGKNMKINGVCLHHDAGALGAVVNRRAIERQLEIMKEMGANAIRVSHNPPAPELLELCDSMGLMVMDETFDMWRKKKTEHDYSRYFNEWHERDLKDLIKRDRNHPSIIMWSIGNEVLEQWSHADADTLSLEQANLILNFGHGKEMLAHRDSAMSVNSLLTVKLADMVRELDSTRPVTAGCNEPDPGNHLFRSNALDVIGYNYHDDYFNNTSVIF